MTQGGPDVEALRSNLESAKELADAVQGLARKPWYEGLWGATLVPILTGAFSLTGTLAGSCAAARELEGKYDEMGKDLRMTQDALAKTSAEASVLKAEIEKHRRNLDEAHVALIRDSLSPETPNHLRVAAVAGVCSQEGSDSLRRSVAMIAAGLGMICSCRESEGYQCSDACVAAVALSTKDRTAFDTWLRSPRGGCSKDCKSAPKGKDCNECVEREVAQFSPAIGVCARVWGGASPPWP